MEDKVIKVSDNVVRVETTIPEQVIPERVETKEYDIDFILTNLRRLKEEKFRIDSEISKTEELLTKLEVKIPDCPMDATEQIEK